MRRDAGDDPGTITNMRAMLAHASAIREARLCEDTDPDGFARNLRLAFEGAQKDAKGLRFFRSWRKLVSFYLSVFDLSAAKVVAQRARRWRLPGSEQQVRDLDSFFAAEIEPLRHAIDQARDDLKLIAEGRRREFKEDAIAVLIPSCALAISSRNPVFADIRRVLRAVFEALDHDGLGYAAYGRLSNHGSPLVPPRIRYISHHTLNASGNGLHFKATDRPHCFSLDQQGYSGWSKFADLDPSALNSIDQELADSWFEADCERIVSQNMSKYAQPAGSKAPDLPQPWIFIALQTVNDAVQQLAHIPMLDMLTEVAEVGNRIGIPVVVKRHPRCRSDEVKAALESGVQTKRFAISDASIHQLIGGSCAVCTVNSSVGAEALLHLKPVYLFGRSEYQHACFRMTKRGEFSTTFTPDKLPLPAASIRKFLVLLRTVYSSDLGGSGFPQFVQARVRELSERLRTGTLEKAN
jgi:Capsule polysaccharide biosynthesis protein